MSLLVNFVSQILWVKLAVLEHFWIIFLLGHLFGSCIHWFKDANICSSFNYFLDYRENIRHKSINFMIWVLEWPEKHPQWDIGSPGFSHLTHWLPELIQHLSDLFRLVFSSFKSCCEWPWDPYSLMVQINIFVKGTYFSAWADYPLRGAFEKAWRHFLLLQ